MFKKIIAENNIPNRIIKVPIRSLARIYNAYDLHSINTRSLSDDFIDAVIIQSKQIKPINNKDIFELQLIAPKNLRIDPFFTAKNKNITRNRIKEYFAEQYEQVSTKQNKKIIKTATLGGIGVVSFMIVVLTGVFSKINKTQDLHPLLALELIYQLMTFSWWLALWETYNLLGSKSEKNNILLFKKLAEANIHFKYKNIDNVLLE